MINKKDTKVITNIADENWGYTEIFVEAQKMDRETLEKKYSNNTYLLIKFRRELNNLEDINDELVRQNRKLTEIQNKCDYDELDSYWELLEKYKKLKERYEKEHSLTREWQDKASKYKDELYETKTELEWWIGCKTTDLKAKYGADKIIVCRDLEEK